jgi:hypothetical protein
MYKYITRQLTFKDSKQGPRNGDRRSDVALGRLEGICRSRSLEEQPAISIRTGSRPRRQMIGTHKPRNTKTLVNTPAVCVCALTPNASNAVTTTRTVVQPW